MRRPAAWQAALTLAGAAAIAAALAAAPPAAPDPPAAAADPAFARWLEEVELLLTDAEREALDSLARPHQRRLFVERFWQVRDPYPETSHNEFREIWELRAALARSRYQGLDDPRAQAVLIAGPPDRTLEMLCTPQLRPLEVWLYGRTPRVRREFTLVFVLRGGGVRAWHPTEGLSSLLDFATGFSITRAGAVELLMRECPQGEEAVAALLAAADLKLLMREPDLIPQPDDEWVAAFLHRTTDLPPGADTFDAEVKFHFPGRRQSRTTVEGLITVPRAAAGVHESAGGRSYNFDIEGEVLRGEELFDRFRYRFDLPAAELGKEFLPLVVRRYLRPGEYTLILRVQDRNSGRFHRFEEQLEVPRVGAVRQTAEAADPLPAVPRTAASLELEQVLAEADAGVTDTDQLIRILQPPEGLHTGRLRVEAAVAGDDISKVQFHLDGRPIFAKTRPPFSVELDLGRAPQRHQLEALGIDRDGKVVARDKVSLNVGPYSFDVRLLEPQPGKRYGSSLIALAEVDLPADEQLDRLEIYLEETLLATLYQEPFVQPIVLPESSEISYVKAVAYLADGHSDQDVVFINTPTNLDQIEIRLIELYTSVVDRRGRPVEGLETPDFVVLEDGLEQRLRRVERVTNVPISAGIVLDTSTSMIEELGEAQAAAQKFFERVLRPQDRAAVLVFNDSWELKVPLTNRLEELAGGLHGLEAEGETALYDSLVQALYYMSGLRGKRAVILITDGQDSRSRYRYEEALEFARRSGVAIYAIGLALSREEFEVVSKLRRLAHETGGECFTIDRAAELDRIYQRIEEELRSQYLLAYQSSQVGGEEYRKVEVRIERPGLKAKTVPGYYP